MLPLTYEGTVESNEDPMGIGRLKIRVPLVYGPGGQGQNSIATDDIPWARPAGLPAGGSPASGAMQWLPNVGDHVFVRFLDGEPEKPIWEWGGQDVTQAEKYPYWKRSPGGYEGTKAPDATALLRYGHMLELAPQSAMLSTSRGYALILTDATEDGYGMAQLLTAKGYQVTVDDQEDRMTIYCPNISILFEIALFVGTRCNFSLSELFQVSSAEHQINAGHSKHTTTEETEVTAGTRMSVEAPRVNLGKHQADDSVVRLSDLNKLANAIMSIFNAHTHIGNLGKPTSPPIRPMQLTPTGSEITYSA